MKATMTFDPAIQKEIEAEAARLDRSLSWVVQRAWKLARKEIKAVPGLPQEDDDAQG